MKRIITVLILIFTCIATNDQRDVSSKVDRDRAYLQEIMKPFKRRHEKRIINMILRHSYIQGHCPRMMGRLCRRESAFRYWALSPKYNARGLWQVRYFHNHILYYVDHRRLGRKLLKEKNPDHNKYWHYIGYSTEGAMILLKSLVDRYGSYPLSLLAYNIGEFNDEFDAAEKNPELCLKYSYVLEVMGE